jgi:hypothetical protein
MTMLTNRLCGTFLPVPSLGGAKWEIDLAREGVVQQMKMMYYPFVHPPRPVLWQALLYWDELTSISPEDGPAAVRVQDQPGGAGVSFVRG